ncbi:thiol-disulfide oxidoreductase DCC family protein [Rossellomorea marisflavi]|uniref:thiol-disulfide oxidoreductase DCC family protein n=1 Tax=Rossellomorea marisflavi TaxID=189381 RepID=UPI003B587F9F|nr:DCC1-like thiol-disulfide oxidoreductase family protein [Rossellomorea marisflavi]
MILKKDCHMDILVYDGNCDMCSNFIRFIIRINRNEKLKITNFESEWYKKNIAREIESMIFIRNNQEYLYSDSVIKLLVTSNKLFTPLYLLYFFPKILRNFVYKLVAKNRRKIPMSSCTLISPEKRKYFL